MRELALFAGGGGGLLGGYLLGWKTVCAVEINNYARDVLLARQRDGILSAIPIWDDITTFDGVPWAGRCDIITGGFPCQDISCAGKRTGITGPKSGLWKEMARVVREVRSKFVFVENSPGLFSPIRKNGRWIGPPGITTIFRDLAEMGYYARWAVLGAEDARAPHERKRAWILAYTNSRRFKKRSHNITDTTRRTGFDNSNIDWWEIDPADLPDTHNQHVDLGGLGTSKILQQGQARIQKCEIPYTKQNRLQGSKSANRKEEKMRRRFTLTNKANENWPAQSFVGRVANGVARRVDRLKTIGNAQVPAVAALAFLILSEGLI